MKCEHILCEHHSIIHRICEQGLDPETCGYTKYQEGYEKGFSECLYDYSIFLIIWKRIVKLIRRVV